MRGTSDPRYVKRLLVAGLLLTLTVFSALPDESDDTTVTHSISWSTGELFFTISRPVPNSGANRPAAVSRVQTAIRNDAVSIIENVLEDVLPYDSYYTLKEYLTENEGAIARVLDAARSATAIEARASDDLLSAEVTYRLDLYGDVVSQLIEHETAAPVTRILGWLPGGDYTGVLIYAAEPLPHIDTGTEEMAEPTLFPGIYYRAPREEELYRLIEAENVEPEYLSRWGVVGYTTDPYAFDQYERIGDNPLRIMAIGCFGAHPTDLVIRREHAVQLLASEANRRLLAEGRVVAIVARPDGSEP